MTRNILVLTAMSLCSITAISAQTEPSPGGTLPSGPNGNDAKREAHKQKMLQKFDANHDGTLDDGERAQMREAMQQRRMQKQVGGGAAAAGTGAAGATSGQGFAGQHGAWGGGDNPQRQEMKQKLLQKFDADHNGQLDDNEKAQMREFMQRRRQEREQQGSGGFGGPPGGGSRGGLPEGSGTGTAGGRPEGPPPSPNDQ